MFSAIQDILRNKGPQLKEVEEAYDQWAGSYDNQAGNLMLHLDEELVEAFLQKLVLTNKAIADVGCGTGRHWTKLYACKPLSVVGLDVSKGMLTALLQKFPGANVLCIQDGQPYPLETQSIDCIISTLTMAHVENLDALVREWDRILVQGGDILLTDFHPLLLASGGQRTFKSGGKTFIVKNNVHGLEDIEQKFAAAGISVYEKLERHIDMDLRPFYAAQNALAVFEKFRGMPVIYGLHLKKN